jgi:hypothetical protein
MPRKNFGEFMEILPKGLNPLKLQTNFKLIRFLFFIIQILLGIWTSHKKEVCSFQILIVPCQVLKFLVQRK